MKHKKDLEEHMTTPPTTEIFTMDQKLELLEVLSEHTNFQIFILLAIYRELTLSELDEKMTKSRATVHRHLQDLLESELIQISKQEIIRGHIPANYYQVNMHKVMGIGQFSEADVHLMQKEPKQYRKFKQFIIQQTLSTCKLIQNNLKILENFLVNFDIEDNSIFSEFFNLEHNPTFLSFGLMTTHQHDRYMEEFLKFNQEFHQKMVRENMMQLEEEKPYINFFGIIQMQTLFEKLKSQQNQTTP